MGTFLQSYLANKQDVQEMKCEKTLNNCNCGDDDNVEKCEYNCYVNAGMTDCVENNPYYNDDQNANNAQDDFDVMDYTYCTQVGQGGNDNGGDGRLLRQLDQNEVEYFLGPYCSDKGDQINFGLFTDDTCTEFADSLKGSTTYYQNFGSSIPYYGKSLVDSTCYSCTEYDYDNYETSTKDMCVDTYNAAGKCESKLSDTVYYPNENACSYMNGIKILKHSSNGVVYSPYRGTKWAAITIAIFATTFVLLAFYTCYLKNRVKILMALAAANASSTPKEKRGFWKTLVKTVSPKKKKLSFNRSNRSKRSEALI